MFELPSWPGSICSVWSFHKRRFWITGRIFGLVQHPMRLVVVGRLVVGQRLDAAFGQVGLALLRPGPAATCSRPRWPWSPGRPTPPRAWRPPAGAACSRTTRRSWSPCRRRRCIPSFRRWAAAALRRFPPSRPSRPLRRACNAVESPAVSLPKSGTAVPSRCDHRVEDPPQLRTVRLLAQHVQEPRDVPSLGNVLFLFDADQPPQGLVAARVRPAWPRMLTCRRAIRSSSDAPERHAPGNRCGRGRDAAAALPTARRRGRTRGIALMVPRLGLSSRQSQANSGLVMAMCMGTSLSRWIEGIRWPQYTSQRIPAQGVWWSKNRRKSTPAKRPTGQIGPSRGERPFRPLSNSPSSTDFHTAQAAPGRKGTLAGVNALDYFSPRGPSSGSQNTLCGGTF